MKILSAEEWETTVKEAKANAYDEISKYLETTVNIEPKYIDINRLYKLVGITLSDKINTKLEIPPSKVTLHINIKNESEDKPNE